jgi:hypothetical protein
MSGFGKQVVSEARRQKKLPAPKPNIDDLMFTALERDKPIDDGLPKGKGLYKAFTEDDLPHMYGNSSAPLMEHASGVEVDKSSSSVQPIMQMQTNEDLNFTGRWRNDKEVPRYSEYGIINPHQYIMDTVYKPRGLEDAAKKRLENNPYFRPEGGEYPTNAELMVYNSDYAGAPGRGGFARHPRDPSEGGGAIGVGGYQPAAQGILRHEARHVITKPDVYDQPANIDVTNALADDIVRRKKNVDQAFGTDAGVEDDISSVEMLTRQKLDSVHELVAHLGDAHDAFVTKHGRMVETEADARQAIEEWAAQPDDAAKVEPLAKRQVLLNAFNGNANDALSRILRHMYAVPIAIGAGSQSQDKPRVTEGLLK